MGLSPLHGSLNLLILPWLYDIRNFAFKLEQFSLEDAGSALRALSTGGTMGFIMEFAENLILRLMEDPKERARGMKEHMYKTKAAGKKWVDDFSLPIRPYGFWTFERHNAQLRWDPQISHAAGRRDPYDEVLEQTYKDASK